MSDRTNLLLAIADDELCGGNTAVTRDRVDLLLSLADDELVLGSYGLSYLLREFGVDVEGVPEVTAEELQARTRRIGDTWGECRGLEAMARRALRAGDGGGVSGGRRHTPCVRLSTAH